MTVELHIFRNLRKFQILQLKNYELPLCVWDIYRLPQNCLPNFGENYLKTGRDAIHICIHTLTDASSRNWQRATKYQKAILKYFLRKTQTGENERAPPRQYFDKTTLLFDFLGSGEGILGLLTNFDSHAESRELQKSLWVRVRQTWSIWRFFEKAQGIVGIKHCECRTSKWGIRANGICRPAMNSR